MVEERLKDLYQKFYVDGNLLKVEGSINHHRDVPVNEALDNLLNISANE